MKALNYKSVISIINASKKKNYYHGLFRFVSKEKWNSKAIENGIVKLLSIPIVISKELHRWIVGDNLSYSLNII